MKTLRNVFRVMIAMIGASLVYSGVVWAFSPDANFALYDIQVNTLGGLNMIKSDIGGPLTMAGMFSILYAIRGEKWYMPTLLLGASYLLVRTTSMISDGFSEVALVGIIMEFIFVVMVIAVDRIGKRLSEEA